MSRLHLEVEPALDVLEYERLLDGLALLLSERSAGRVGASARTSQGHDASSFTIFCMDEPQALKTIGEVLDLESISGFVIAFRPGEKPMVLRGQRAADFDPIHESVQDSIVGSFDPANVPYSDIPITPRLCLYCKHLQTQPVDLGAGVRATCGAGRTSPVFEQVLDLTGAGPQALAQLREISRLARDCGDFSEAEDTAAHIFTT